MKSLELRHRPVTKPLDLQRPDKHTPGLFKRILPLVAAGMLFASCNGTSTSTRALLLAVQDKDTAMVRSLLAKGADPNASFEFAIACNDLGGIVTTRVSAYEVAASQKDREDTVIMTLLKNAQK
jgi:hypothetical protein